MYDYLLAKGCWWEWGMRDLKRHLLAFFSLFCFVFLFFLYFFHDWFAVLHRLRAASLLRAWSTMVEEVKENNWQVVIDRGNSFWLPVAIVGVSLARYTHWSLHL